VQAHREQRPFRVEPVDRDAAQDAEVPAARHYERRPVCPGGLQEHVEHHDGGHDGGSLDPMAVEVGEGLGADTHVEARVGWRGPAPVERLRRRGNGAAHEDDLRPFVAGIHLRGERGGARIERNELDPGLLEELGQAGGHHSARPRTPGEGADDALRPAARALAGGDAAEDLVRHRVRRLRRVAEAARDRREQDEHLKWVAFRGREEVTEAVDLGAEDQVELLVGLRSDGRVGEDASPVDDPAYRAVLGPRGVDGAAYRCRAAHVHGVVAHLRTGALERGHVVPNLPAVEDDLGVSCHLLGGDRHAIRLRSREQHATDVGVGRRRACLGRLLDQLGTSEQREPWPVLAESAERRGGHAARPARYDHHHAFAQRGRDGSTPIGRGGVAHDGAAAGRREAHFDLAAPEDQLVHDALCDRLVGGSGAFHIDGLRRDVRPLGRGRLGEPGQASSPCSLAGPARQSEIPAGVLQRHEDTLLCALREGPRARQSRALDGDRVVD
jgi:hypothetical protein